MINRKSALALALAAATLAVAACGGGSSTGPGRSAVPAPSQQPSEGKSAVVKMPPLNPAALRRSRSFSAIPLTDLGSGTYEGFAGGLYPGGSNTMPSAQSAAGLARARRVQPLDASGKASPQGKIGLLAISMSNGSAEWCGLTTCQGNVAAGRSFMAQAAASRSVNHQALVIASGAHGGQTADRWTSPSSPDYDYVRDDQLAPAGLTEKQVQVVWVEQADAYPTTALPSPGADAYRLEAELGQMLRALKVRYPHLQEVFLSSRAYGGYATATLNPEPYAYETGFSAKWVIQAQIQQMRHGGQITDPRAGDLDYGTAAPWAAWGPYFWADGTRPRSDGLTWLRGDFAPDGTHPSASGIAKAGTMLLDFFLSSPYTRCWFRSPAQHAQCTA